MRMDCPDPADLSWWSTMPDGDPRRLHTRTCPRCGACLASLGLFQDPPPLPPGADPADADVRLASFLQREVVASRAVGQLEPRARTVWFTGRRQLVAASVVVALAGLYAGRALLRPASPIILREANPGAATVRLDSVAWQRGGALRVTWSPAPGAEAYAVLLLDAGGNELTRLPAAPGGELVIAPGGLDALAAVSPLFAQVVALRSGDEFARSLPRLVPSRPAM